MIHPRLTGLIIAAFCLMGTALAQTPSPDELGMDESEMVERARQGRLSEDELVRRGEDISYFTKLKLYIYAQELEPFFLGLEDTLRDLARTDPGDLAATEKARDRIAEMMSTCRKRLEEAGRDDLELEWRRGLAGLIFLDHEWRKRVHRRGKDEIKNHYDLVALLDCLDSNIRNKGPDTKPCPVLPVERKKQ